MWVTNANFAHVFIVFAKIEDDKNVSSFILTKDMKGLTIGKEYNKLGLAASSTCPIYFDEV